jgi:hypothetical protein
LVLAAPELVQPQLTVEAEAILYLVLSLFAWAVAVGDITIVMVFLEVQAEVLVTTDPLAAQALQDRATTAVVVPGLLRQLMVLVVAVDTALMVTTDQVAKEVMAALARLV